VELLASSGRPLSQIVEKLGIPAAAELAVPKVTDPEAPPIRPERHIANAIATMRRRLIMRSHVASHDAHAARSSKSETVFDTLVLTQSYSRALSKNYVGVEC
jgi:hypothetical protein